MLAEEAIEDVFPLPRELVGNGTLWCLGVAAFAAKAAGRIRQSHQAWRWINRALGGLFVYLGVRVALLQTR